MLSASPCRRRPRLLHSSSHPVLACRCLTAWERSLSHLLQTMMPLREPREPESEPELGTEPGRTTKAAEETLAMSAPAILLLLLLLLH